MIRAVAILSTLLLLWATLALSQPARAPAEPAMAESEPAWVTTATHGDAVDFDKTCPPVIDPWPPDDDCRTVSPATLQRLLLQEAKTAAASRHGLRLNGAVITGDLELQDAQIARPLAITNSYINGNIDFSRSHFASGVSLSRSEISGSFSGSGMSVGGNLELEQTLVGRQVNLIGATVNGFGHFGNLATHQLVLDSARFRHDLILDGVTLTHDAEIGTKYPCGERDLPDADLNVLCGRLVVVEGQLRIGGRVAPDNVFLADADIQGDLTVGGVKGTLNLDSIHVRGTLHMHEAGAEYGDIILRAAEIDHYWLLRQAAHVGQIEADNLHVKQEAVLDTNLAMLRLPGARFDAKMMVTLRKGVSPTASVDLTNMRVGNTLRLLCQDVCSLDFRFLNVGEDLDLSGSVVTRLDLSQAKVGGSLDLRNVRWPPQPQLARNPQQRIRLHVTNAQVAAALGRAESWPDKTDLHGFTYTDLPDIDEAQRQAWLERAPKYEPQAYTHLASVLTVQGDREGAAEIQYAARERDLRAAWDNHRYGTAAFLLSLSWLGNYGIGNKTWWCIVPILVFATSGALVIRSVPGARGRGRAWLFGAGLHNLLPYRPIDHSIADFLDRQEGFRVWHKLVLFVFALFGIVLALFLAAAAAGLTQRA